MKEIIFLVYRKLLPKILRKKIRYLYFLKFRYFFDPPFINAAVGNRMDEYIEAYKKDLNKINQGNINFSPNVEYNLDFLHQSFNKFGVRSNNIISNWWSGFVKLSCLGDEKKFDQLNKSLIDQIKNSNFDSLEYWEIMNISVFSSGLGLIDLGYHLRKKAIKVALNYPSVLDKYKSWKLKAKLSALLENLNYNEFDQLLPLLKKRSKKFYFGFYKKIKKRWAEEHFQLNYLRRLIEINKLSVNKDLNDLDNLVDLKFRKLIEGKKIAIVGPVESDQKNGREIDSHEIVIRFNQLKKNGAGNPIIKGSKCDITYLSGGRAEFLKKNGAKGWSSNVPWIICKEISGLSSIVEKFRSDGTDLKSLNFRALKLVDLAVFKGNLLFVPLVVLDILRFAPAKISIFHVDLYLTGKKNEEYSANLPSGYERMVPIFISKNHDIISQYLILEQFWKKGLITGDKRFDEIMKMGEEKYNNEYQKIYRKKIMQIGIKNYILDYQKFYSELIKIRNSK